MKITHFFILNDEDTNPFSGAENHIWELLKGSSSKNNIELLLSVGITGTIINNRIEELKIAGVEVTLIQKNIHSFSTINYLRMIQECVIYSKEFRKRKDRILHLHLNSNIIPITAILSGHKNIYFSFHNDEPYFKKTLSKFFLKRMFFWFRHTIAITQHVKDYLVNEAELPEDKITVIRYGINPPPLKDLKDIQMPNLPGEIKLCFVGRLTEQKNLFFFFECLKEFPEASLVLFGDGPDKQRLLDYAINLGINNRIYFYGYLDNASSYIKSFDFLCLPSKWEGLGLVLIEAMYQKVPIIGSEAGAIPEVLDYGNLGTIISYTDIDSAVCTIKKTFSDKVSTLTKRDLALEYAEKNYTVERMVEETNRLYLMHSKINPNNNSLRD